MAKRNKWKARDILIAWLKNNVGTSVVPSHRIELELPRYGQLLFDSRHNPATYSREWRLLREDVQTLSACGLEVHEIPDAGGAEKSWRVMSK